MKLVGINGVFSLIPRGLVRPIEAEEEARWMLGAKLLTMLNGWRIQS